jgi:hypothetical protein
MTATKISIIPPRKMSERALMNRLRLNLIIISVIIVLVILGIFVFAPQVGTFFGFFSIHRNEAGYQPTAKPTPPVFSNVPEAVKDETISLSGRALPGTTIKLYVNGPQIGTSIAASDGVFTIADIKLSMGKNMIYAKASDDKGNESEMSEILDINYDKDAPKIEITSPKDKGTITNLNKRVEITGKIDEKATITINDNTAIQKPDFSFDFWLGVSEGSVKIKVTAIDMAGNKSDKEITVRYVRG